MEVRRNNPRFRKSRQFSSFFNINLDELVFGTPSVKEAEKEPAPVLKTGIDLIYDFRWLLVGLRILII